jgi:hypothetical protein
VTPSAAFALERLAHLATLFDHARLHARGDSLALSEILEQAAMLLDEIAPAVAASKGGPDEGRVIDAALRAREHHAELVRTIGLEIDRITRELERLSRSSQANARYGAVAQSTQAPRLRLIERSA